MTSNEQKLIDELIDEIESIVGSGDCGEALSGVMDIINKLKRVEARNMTNWIKIKDNGLPETLHEVDQFDDDCFDGYVSDSFEITDGWNLARGHYRSDGRWVIYEAEHDFQMVEADEITHYGALPKLPDRV